MTEYHWGPLRDHAIASFGDTPGSDLEQRIIDVFVQHPQIVAALIDAVAARVKAGKVRSGWAILATECERSTTTADTRATDTTDRDRAKRNAAQRINAELLHFDRESEVVDELFGERGHLRHWPELEDEYVALWQQNRPRGELVERQAEERGGRYIEQRKPKSKPVEVPF